MLIFSYLGTQKLVEVFPVDVWIKRVMEELFIHKQMPVKKISSYANEIFKENAGLAQQYLFYYARKEKNS